MRRTVSIERLPQGYSVRHWVFVHEEGGKGVYKREREWFKDYGLAQKRKTALRLKLEAASQGQADPTIRPIDLFHTYLQALAKGTDKKPPCRQSTLDLKNCALKNFVTGLPILTYNSLVRFKIDLESKYNQTTVSIRLREARALCNWATENKYFKETPFHDIVIPPSKEPGYKLEIDEIQQIWEASDPLFRPYLALLQYHGPRRTEPLLMEWPHLDLERGTWTIPAENCKTKRARTIPLEPEVVDELRKLPRHSNKVFEGWTKDTPRRYLNKACKKAGITKRVTPHIYRHSFASHWKGRTRTLMDIMGWRTLAMPNRYTHLEVEDIRHEATSKGIAAALREG